MYKPNYLKTKLPEYFLFKLLKTIRVIRYFYLNNPNYLIFKLKTINYPIFLSINRKLSKKQNQTGTELDPKIFTYKPVPNFATKPNHKSK